MRHLRPGWSFGVQQCHNPATGFVDRSPLFFSLGSPSFLLSGECFPYARHSSPDLPAPPPNTHANSLERYQMSPLYAQRTTAWSLLTLNLARTASEGVSITIFFDRSPAVLSYTFTWDSHYLVTHCRRRFSGSRPSRDRVADRSM